MKTGNEGKATDSQFSTLELPVERRRTNSQLPKTLLICLHLLTLPTKRKRPLLTRKTAFLKSGSPGGIRTPDQLVNSQLLYRLSYRGTIEPFSNIRAVQFLGGKRIQPAGCMLTKILRAEKIWMLTQPQLSHLRHHALMMGRRPVHLPTTRTAKETFLGRENIRRHKRFDRLFRPWFQ